MRKFTRYLANIGVPRNNPELARAQIEAFVQHIPYMYAIVGISTFLLAREFYGLVPDWLSVYLPAGLVLVGIFRSIHYRSLKPSELEGQALYTKLRVVWVLAAALGFAFMSWSLALWDYGSALNKAHIVLYGGVTVFGIMVCLLHLRLSALLLGASTIGPMTVFLIFQTESEFVSMGVNVFLVGVLIAVMLNDSAKDFSRLIAHQTALTLRQRETQRLSDSNQLLANRDSLTQLSNRRSFFAELDRLMAQGDTENIAVGIFDLDGFKPINDVYGHIAGDQMLIEVGTRLTEAMPDAFVARMGGDEFAFIFEAKGDDASLIAAGQRLCRKLKHPIDCGQFEARMSASVGLARGGSGAEDSSTLYEHADYALYHAKEHCKGDAVLFSAEHGQAIHRRSLVERLLREADLKAELRVVFQFIKDTKTDSFVGAEALARWDSPVLGNVSPEEFIRAAERMGMVSKLSEILLEKTLDAVVDWPEELFVSFNLSTNDVGSTAFIEKLGHVLDRWSLPAGRLTLEITESAVVQDFDRAISVLRNLRAKGINIALDDFGTGYSSLTYLRQLPLDRLKVDRSFIKDISRDERAEAIVGTIVHLCKTLDLDIIVEGVETQDQALKLTALGCGKLQGYLFSRPVDAAVAREIALTCATAPSEIRLLEQSA